MAVFGYLLDLFIHVGGFTANKAGLTDRLVPSRVRDTLILLHRQTRGRSDTFTPTPGSSVAGHHCLKAGG